MQTYDAMLTVGNGLTANWQLPDIVTSRLAEIATMFANRRSDHIIVSGGWSISYDLRGIRPPTTEAAEMKRMLVALGVPAERILTEERSRDTIGNAYFSKVEILQPNGWKKIMVVCADFHLPRVKFLFEKILGPGYDLAFHTTPSTSGHDVQFMTMQRDILEMQKKFLHPMQPGHDDFLSARLYTDPYYVKRRPAHIAEVAMRGTQ